MPGLTKELWEKWYKKHKPEVFFWGTLSIISLIGIIFFLLGL